MKVGDLIAFKPKTFSDMDWSNPGILLNKIQSTGWPTEEDLWVIWIDGMEYIVNERNDEVMHLTSSLQRNG